MRCVPMLAPTLAFVLALSPAIAGAQPTAPVLLQPSRDVVVRYQVEGDATSLLPGGLPGPVSLSWDAANRRVRADAQGRNQVALLNLDAGSGTVFDTELRVVLPLHLRPGALGPLTLAGAHLQPRGRDVVAGLPCTDYAVAGRVPGTVCLTTDGVPLRGTGTVEGRAGRFTALSVTYGPVPPALFEPPPGYVALGSGKAGGLDLRSLGRSLLGQGVR